MTDIWIVTSGEYSSYSVDAAFSTMEAADTWAARMNVNEPKVGGGLRYGVERIDLDPPLPELVKQVIEEPPPRSVRIDVSEAIEGIIL